ncbi:MAG: EF2563 family selenium-dependent molybdenum hydroxylase system protein [Eubacterium sp.]|nr:EF2563 family selenium-dependent molybdenum hydroxylase system protein [Eubacterium sp.]
MNKLIVVRGGGDIASGTIHRLYKAGYKKILVLESEKPAAIRRAASFCEALYEGMVYVEGVIGIKLNPKEFDKGLEAAFKGGMIPVCCDPLGKEISRLRPEIIVDAILAKKNMGTFKGMAPVVVALGPGFYAGKDADYVIETMRGHNLGRIITEGCALENTGVPGEIQGVSKERVIYSPVNGKIKASKEIGDIVKEGDIIAEIKTSDGNVTLIRATISGVLRGIIRDGYIVTDGLKIADIDPRIEEKENCFTISDKARNIGGSVLEIVSAHYNADDKF